MPIIPPTPPSQALLQTIVRAETMHSIVQANIPDRLVLDTTEITLVAAFFSLATEHHSAILYLLRTGRHDGSALALVRPLIDACYRAHWLYACAKPELIERIGAGESCYPGLPNMAEEVEKKVDAGGFFQTIIPSINSLHGYTHGGLEQLARRFSIDGNMRPNYTDEEKQEAINVSTAHFTALAMAWCQLIAGKVISAKYNELYGGKEPGSEENN